MQVVDVLLQAGADPTLQINGDPPLKVALYAGKAV